MFGLNHDYIHSQKGGVGELLICLTFCKAHNNHCAIEGLSYYNLQGNFCTHTS